MLGQTSWSPVCPFTLSVSTTAARFCRADRNQEAFKVYDFYKVDMILYYDWLQVLPYVLNTD